MPIHLHLGKVSVSRPLPWDSWSAAGRPKLIRLPSKRNADLKLLPLAGVIVLFLLGVGAPSRIALRSLRVSTVNPWGFLSRYVAAGFTSTLAVAREGVCVCLGGRSSARFS